ncbi:hypothetical protein IKE71_01200 [Candidatus Saccharibacteria bacterium]|nr:hypothetical protein [Candidatus Saccharibacteria bacterium]
METSVKPPSRLKTFYKEHRLAFFSLLSGALLILILIVVIFTTLREDDGVLGTDSRSADLSLAEDQKALQATEAFKISAYLPITSADPAYKISYLLDRDETGNYSFKLSLNAFTASARTPMIERLLSESFGSYDPLDYEIVLENYRNPFANFSLDDLKSGRLPTNFKTGNLYKFGDSKYTVQTLTHTLYDGSTNTYRYVLENGEPKTLPQLFFTYKDLDFLEKSIVKSINALE